MQGLSDRERRQLLQTLQTIKGNLVRAEVARA
jgi:hypothetical protein